MEEQASERNHQANHAISLGRTRLLSTIAMGGGRPPLFSSAPGFYRSTVEVCTQLWSMCMSRRTSRRASHLVLEIYALVSLQL